MKGMEMIIGKPLNSLFFDGLREQLQTQNPALVQFVISRTAERFESAAMRERVANTIVTGLAVLGAADDSEGAGSVLVSEKSIAEAEEKTDIRLLADIEDYDTALAARFDEAMSCVQGVTSILDVYSGSVGVAPETVLEESIIFFDAYFREIEMQGL